MAKVGKIRKIPVIFCILSSSVFSETTRTNERSLSPCIVWGTMGLIWQERTNTPFDVWWAWECCRLHRRSVKIITPNKRATGIWCGFNLIALESTVCCIAGIHTGHATSLSLLKEQVLVGLGIRCERSHLHLTRTLIVLSNAGPGPWPGYFRPEWS